MSFWSDWFNPRPTTRFTNENRTVTQTNPDGTTRTYVRPRIPSRPVENAQPVNQEQLTPADREAIARENAADRAGTAAQRRAQQEFLNNPFQSRPPLGTESPSPAISDDASAAANTVAPNYEFNKAELEQLQFASNTTNTAFSSRRSANRTFSISKFRTEVTGSDSILPNHSFIVVFSPFKNEISSIPGVSADASRAELIRARNSGIAIPPISLTTSQKVSMRCDNIILPNLALLQEQNIRRYGYGPVENVAYGVNVGDISMEFIVDKDSEIITFFDNWFSRIVNRDSKGGADMSTKSVSGYSPYEVGYKDNYTCPSINVFVYDRSEKLAFEYNIFDAFPTNFQSINLSWADENSMMKIIITFSFTDFNIRNPNTFLNAFSEFSSSEASQLDVVRNNLNQQINQNIVESTSRTNEFIQANPLPTSSVSEPLQASPSPVSPTTPTITPSGERI